MLSIFPDWTLCDVKVNINDSYILSSNTPLILPTVCKSAVIKGLRRISSFQPENFVYVGKEYSRR